MALAPNTLKADLKSAILAQIQSLFPISGSLLPAEQTLIATYQSKIAEAIGYGDGPTTISHFQTYADVQPNTLAVTPSAMSNGAGALTGSGAVNVGLGKVA